MYALSPPDFCVTRSPGSTCPSPEQSRGFATQLRQLHVSKFILSIYSEKHSVDPEEVAEVAATGVPVQPC